jgi:hypothetical protein
MNTSRAHNGASEQAQEAVDTYFDFLKRSVASYPSGGTELGEQLKDQAAENINAVHEQVKRLSQAKDFNRREQTNWPTLTHPIFTDCQ